MMDVKVVIEFDYKPDAEKSKLANILMGSYFQFHNILASEAFEKCESREFYEEECKNDELANHWLTASDVAFVAVCGGIDDIADECSLRVV